MLKLVFAGTPDVAVPSLKAFATDPRFDVVGVITRPDAPTGRGRKLTPSPVKATALELGLPVIDLKPRSPEFMEALNDLHADIAAVIAYGNILPKNVLMRCPWLVQPAFLQPAEVAWRRSRPACDLGGRPDHRRRRVQGGRGFG